MMKEYSLHRKRTPIFRRSLFSVGVLLVGLAVLLLLSVPQMRGATLSFFEPFLKLEQGASTTLEAAIGGLTPKRVLLSRVKVLEAERDHILAQAQSFEVLVHENAELKKLLGRSVYESTILASVISRPTKTAYDTFIIDVGEPEVASGNLVLVDGVVGIGKIAEVYPGASLVSLFSSPGLETEALIGPERVPVIAVGQGGGSFVAEFPREAHVEEGFAVILPGITPHIFARIESIEVSSADPFITVRFKGPVNLQSVTWVSVLTDISEVPSLDTAVDTMVGTSTDTYP